VRAEFGLNRSPAAGIVAAMSFPKAHPQMAPLDLPVGTLRGVGSERVALLAKLEIRMVADLLLHRPRRYEDRRQVRPISELALGEPATVHGKIIALGVKRYGRGAKSVFEFILDDGSARLHCRWWNLPFMQHCFQQGNEVMVFGKPNSVRPRTIDHPETEVIEGGEESSIHLNRVTPVYPLTEGLTQRWLRALIWRTLEQFTPAVGEPWPFLLEEGFPGAAQALRSLHFPVEEADAEKARRRFAFEEFLDLQLAIQERRRNLESRASRRQCGGDNRLMRPFLTRLGFQLTGAQTRVLREIRRDMSGEHPMRRLLQGDVGSGKTVVAACAALMALESGFNVVVMAPTEILAGQHFGNFRKWLEPLEVRVELRTGGRREGAATGSDAVAPSRVGTLVVGTHALIEEAFTVERLGLVIIDEQHKFGVTQRERLVRKGDYPHLLVMTATPIPRTLGLTLYGDLDISVIDEVPPGRAPVRTFVRPVEKLPKVWEFIRSRLAEGRQAFVVYPRVEDSGTAGVKAVTKEWETLRRDLAPFEVGLLHGRLKSAEKEAVMSAFRSGAVNVLLATPLIEVGVDVPNATVMLIENAEQFGLAQLHQLRGRVGRGAGESFCILTASSKTVEAKERLQILAGTSDGFKIAEADLKLRGPGDLLGQQQSGLPPLRFGNLSDDLALVERARSTATRLIAERTVKA
jgi:ATP-dependent DNA helicase RecG